MCLKSTQLAVKKEEITTVKRNLYREAVKVPTMEICCSNKQVRDWAQRFGEKISGFGTKEKAAQSIILI